MKHNPKKHKEHRRKSNPNWKPLVATHKVVYEEVPRTLADGRVRVETKRFIISK